MTLDLETMELLNELRKSLNLVEAYWYFVEHGKDGLECGLARKTLAKFRRTAMPKVLELITELHKRERGLDGRD